MFLLEKYYIYRRYADKFAEKLTCKSKKDDVFSFWHKCKKLFLGSFSVDSAGGFSELKN